jgi:hypothetical protein
MRSIQIKMMVAAALVAAVLTSRAETWPAEHAWVLGSHGNYYGLVQWNHSNGTDPGSKRKRTVIYFGASEFTVHQPAVLVAGVGLFGLSSLVLIPPLNREQDSKATGKTDRGLMLASDAALVRWLRAQPVAHLRQFPQSLRA